MAISISTFAHWAGGNEVLVARSTEIRFAGLKSFSSIANAQPGSPIYSRITAWGAAFKNYQAPIYVIFNHEPDASFSQGSGNAAQFQCPQARQACFGPGGKAGAQSWRQASFGYGSAGGLPVLQVGLGGASG